MRIGAWVLLAVCICGLAAASGCQVPVAMATGRVQPRGPTFPTIYDRWLSNAAADRPVTTNQQVVTIAADGMTLAEFLRAIADQAGISVIVESGLEDRTVMVDVRAQPVDDVLSFVARRLGVRLRKEGGLYYVGTLRPEDRAVLVRRVRRLTKEDLDAAVGVFSGESGRSARFKDGLLIVGDTIEALNRINEMIDQVEATDSPVWIVQLHLVSYSATAADELGINIEPAAKAGLAFATGSAAATAGTTWQLAASLNAVLKVAYSRDDVAITAAPMFVLADGEKASFVQGDRVPVPRRTTSPEGTVRTEGFEFIQTGVTVELSLREAEPEAARVTIKVNMSDVKRFVEEAPVTGEERFETVTLLRAGGVYLLGTLVKDRLQSGRSIGWQTNEAKAQEAQVVQVWAQTYRIGGGGVKGFEPAVVKPGMQDTPSAGPEPKSNEGTTSTTNDREVSWPSVYLRK